MADLITSARAKYNINQTSFTAAEDTTIAALVTACSKAVRRYCKREFDSQSFDELYNGDGQTRLLLRQSPVISVARVAYGPSTALRVTNTSSSNQRASVAVTSTGLTLVRVASGTVTTDTSVTFAGNATLNAVATAVNALGNGWSATLADGNYASWPSADLRALQGAQNARNVQAELKIHLNELSDFEVDAQRGWLTRYRWYDWEESRGFVGWYGGINWWRVIYTAGYATVPEDVQEAYAQWVAILFALTKRDPLVTNTLASSTGYGYSMLPDQPPDSVRALLASYRQHLIATGQG